MAGIDFASLSLVLDYITEQRMPVLIRGRHGVGKSEIVYQFAASKKLPVVERRASQMTEGDLVGLPVISGNRTSWNHPDWYKEACETPVVLFLDEVDRATPEVRQGIFELTDSRKMNGLALHPETLVFAAVNGGEHASQYQVGEMDPAELDRWTVFDVEPSVEDWLNWAKAKVNPIVYDFIQQNRSHLEHHEDFEPNKVYPSRRSWKRFNDVIDASGLLDKPGVELYNLCAAFLGMEAAIAFRDFVVNYSRLVTPEDIIDHAKHDKLEGAGINDFGALIDKMEANGWYEKDLTDDQIANLGKLLFMMPSEIAVKFWTNFATGPADNTIRLHVHENEEGVRVGRYMADMQSKGSEEE